MRKKFEEGDRVRLVAPFRCQGDDLGTDEEIERELREAFEGRSPTGTMVEYTNEGWLLVTFDERASFHGADLYVDEDVLELEHPPATDEEVEEAIRSILGA